MRVGPRAGSENGLTIIGTGRYPYGYAGLKMNASKARGYDEGLDPEQLLLGIRVLFHEHQLHFMMNTSVHPNRKAYGSGCMGISEARVMTTTDKRYLSPAWYHLIISRRANAAWTQQHLRQATPS